MNIIYYLDKQDGLRFKLLEKSIISALRTQKEGVHIWLITTKEVSVPEEILKHIHKVEIINLVPNVHYTVNKQRGYGQVLVDEGLYIDTDTIFQADVSHVFKDLAWKIGATLRNVYIGRDRPYNSGVIFSRSREFFNDYAEMSVHKNDRTAEAGFCSLVNLSIYDNTRLILDSSYNYSPEVVSDPKIPEAKIVHYKGNRKQWMLNI